MNPADAQRGYVRLKPPVFLSQFCKGYWIRTLAAFEPEKFTVADEPLLVAFFMEYELLMKLVTAQASMPLVMTGGNGQLTVSPVSNAIAKHNASLAQLASKLRIAPQSLISAKSAQSNAEWKGEKVTDSDIVDDLFLH